MKDKIIDILSRFWFVLLILLCCIVLSIKFASGQTLQIDNARHLMEVYQTKKAIGVLHQVIQSNPSAAAWQYHLGMARIRNGERDLAEKSLAKGISLNSGEPINYVGRGYLAMLENKCEGTSGF